MAAFLDYLVDLINNPFKRVLIITNTGIPVVLYKDQFFVQAISRDRLREFGLLKNDGQGFMCHGYTGKPVRQPYVGQPLFFWTQEKYAVTGTGMSIQAIYRVPIKDQFPSFSNHLRTILEWLNLMKNGLALVNLNILNLAEGDPYGRFADLLMHVAVHYSQDGWTIGADRANELRQIARSPEYCVDLNAFYSSGLFCENAEGGFDLSDGLVALLMMAIHHARPFSTTLDKNGIIQIHTEANK